jgi:hypothetical protein
MSTKNKDLTTNQYNLSSTTCLTGVHTIFIDTQLQEKDSCGWDKF